jgi:hypothetical protein
MADEELSRRGAIKKLAIVVGGATTMMVLPDRWDMPVVMAVRPAHALSIMTTAPILTT